MTYADKIDRPAFFHWRYIMQCQHTNDAKVTSNTGHATILLLAMKQMFLPYLSKGINKATVIFVLLHEEN